MTLAIKFGDVNDESSISGTIYFDAVTGYKKNYSGKVTEHPIEAGASISDHFISHNPKIQISGVITGVDFSPLVWDMLIDDEPVLNRYQQAPAVQVVGAGGGLRQFLPGVITQFLPQINPEVIVEEEDREGYRNEVENTLKDLISGLYYDMNRKRWVNRMTPISLYEIEQGVPELTQENLILSKFSCEEDVDTGDALVFDMELEQVRFVTLEEAEAPKPQRNSATERATTPAKDEGSVTSTPTPVPATERVSSTGSLSTAIN